MCELDINCAASALAAGVVGGNASGAVVDWTTMVCLVVKRVRGEIETLIIIIIKVVCAGFGLGPERRRLEKKKKKSVAFFFLNINRSQLDDPYWKLCGLVDTRTQKRHFEQRPARLSSQLGLCSKRVYTKSLDRVRPASARKTHRLRNTRVWDPCVQENGARNRRFSEHWKVICSLLNRLFFEHFRLPRKKTIRPRPKKILRNADLILFEFNRRFIMAVGK